MQEISIDMKKQLSTVLSILLCFIFIVCEDDPLLAPQQEPEDDGGSYGNLSLPGTINDGADKNPETF